MSKIEETGGFIEELEEEEDGLYKINKKENPVYLAFIDSPLKEDEELNIEDTFIGGKPIWLNSIKPNDELLKCNNCFKSDKMKLLCQAFSPLDVEIMKKIQNENDANNLQYINDIDDRVIYTFICSNCTRNEKSIKCIRGVKKNKKKTSSEIVSEQINNMDEGKQFDITSSTTENSNPFDLSSSGNSNPFSSNGFSDAAANPFASSTHDKKKNDDDEKNIKKPEVNVKSQIKAARREHDLKKDKKIDLNKEFKNYLLYVEEESFNKRKPDHLKLPKNLNIDPNAMSEIEEDELDKNPIKLDPRTEKLSKFLDDDTFQKFQEIIGYNPYQVLRYDIGGEPLYYSKVQKGQEFDKIVSRPSYNPTSKRIFELQLMPKMIMDLEEEIDMEKGMEWGSIMIYVDIENYIPKFDENGVGYVEEVCKVQWEKRE